MSDTNKPEFSESGDRIYRHKDIPKTFTPAVGDEKHIKAVSDHIEKYIGKPSWVFHEIVSDLVHVDIHAVPPQPDRNFHTLITTGMSQRAMKVPRGTEEWAYAELLLCLPPEWPLRDEAFRDDNNYWPLRLLKSLARFPHNYDTWLSLFHTIPNGNPPAPLANTRFIGSMIAPPVLPPPEFWRFRIHPEVTINFFAVIPLYAEEMDFKLKSKNGAEELLARFDKENFTELININRKNVAT